jgi:hypothetical protein
MFTPREPARICSLNLWNNSRALSWFGEQLRERLPALGPRLSPSAIAASVMTSDSRTRVTL